MRKMKLYELVNQYHIGTNLSCAEAMFKACNEYYHLHLSEETRRMFSVMGIGMQTEQSCCGAFTVAVGIIGLMWTIVNKKDTIFKYIFRERLDSLPIPECCFHFVWCQIA